MKRFGLLAPTGLVERRVTTVAIVVVLVAAVAAVVVPRILALPGDAAFRAYDTVVSKTELQRRVQLLGSLYGIQQPPDEAGREAFRRDTARAVATSTVLDEAAAQRGIVIPDKRAQDTLTAMVNQPMGPGGREGYVKLLSESGASEGDVLEEIKRQERTRELFTQVTAGVASTVTEADVRRYYDEHRAEMVTPEQRRLRNIVVTNEGEAADIANRLRGGADFVATAQQSTLDESTRATGGDLGVLPREKLDPAFADAAFAAAPGALFGPVKSQSGWNVGQVLEVAPAVPLTFEQVKEPLNDRLRSERVLAEWRGWQDREIRNADIEYAEEFQEPKQVAAASIGSAPSPPSPGTPAAAASVPPSTTSSAITMVLTMYLVGFALVGIGVWGRRNVGDLVPHSLTTANRAKKRRGLLRGSVTMMAVGALLSVLATVGLVAGLA